MPGSVMKPSQGTIPVQQTQPKVSNIPNAAIGAKPVAGNLPLAGNSVNWSSLLAGTPTQQYAYTSTPSGDSYFPGLMSAISRDAQGQNIVDPTQLEQAMLLGSNLESTWNMPNSGDNGQSWGPYQINSPSHPGVTQAQADDPNWATQYMLGNYQQGVESVPQSLWQSNPEQAAMDAAVAAERPQYPYNDPRSQGQGGVDTAWQGVQAALLGTPQTYIQSKGAANSNTPGPATSAEGQFSNQYRSYLESQIPGLQNQEATNYQLLGQQQQLGQEGINNQTAEGNQALLQQENAIKLQQMGLNNSSALSQEQYNDALAQFGLQGQQLDTNQNNIINNYLNSIQQLGLQKAGVNLSQLQDKQSLANQLYSNTSSATAAGAMNTTGYAHNQALAQQQYANQVQALQNQLSGIGLSEQAANQNETSSLASLGNQRAELGLSKTETQQQRGYTEQSQKIQQQNIDNLSQQLGFSKTDLKNRIQYSIDSLNLSGSISANDILQSYSDALNGLANPFASVLPYILQSANVPNILQSTTSLSNSLGGI